MGILSTIFRPKTSAQSSGIDKSRPESQNQPLFNKATGEFVPNISKVGNAMGADYSSWIRSSRKGSLFNNTADVNIEPEHLYQTLQELIEE